MKLAAHVGISLSDFWEITPYELGIYAGAYSERLKAEYDAKHQSDILQAYLISRWVWQKRVSIRSFLTSAESKHDMTDMEMFARVRALNTAMGGDVVQE